MSFDKVHNWYQKVKDNNNETGNNRQSFVYFELIDAILGTRATSQPMVLVENTTGSIPAMRSHEASDVCYLFGQMNVILQGKVQEDRQ